MNFDLDDEQAMLRDMATRFAMERGDLSERIGQRAGPDGFARQDWAMLAELGLLALPFAGEHGGLDGGVVAIVTVAEAFGRGLVTAPWLGDLLLAGRLLQAGGTEGQRAAWLPRIMAGEVRLVLAHAEHRARFNPLHVRCAVTARGGGAVLNGEKTFVLAGETADGFIISAREAGAPDAADGLSLWLVPADAAGLERRGYRLVDGSVACELRLSDVAGERMAGGAAALLETFDDARVATCAEMVGVMGRLFDATLEHVRTRRQFGQPLGGFQVIQHRMADLYVLLEQSRSQMLRAALTARGDGAAVAGAKSFVSASAVRLGEECIQLHGGMGTSDELDIGHGHKRILVLASLLGDAASELARYARLAA